MVLVCNKVFKRSSVLRDMASENGHGPGKLGIRKGRMGEILTIL